MMAHIHSIVIYLMDNVIQHGKELQLGCKYTHFPEFRPLLVRTSKEYRGIPRIAFSMISATPFVGDEGLRDTAGKGNDEDG